MAEDEGRDLTVMSPPEPAILAAADVPAWCDPRHIAAAWALSEGCSNVQAAEAAGVDESTVRRWLSHPERGREFAGLIERLTPLTGVAQSSARVGLAKELLRQLVDKGVEKALSRTDAVGVMRFIREEVGARGIGGIHPAGQVVQQFFAGPTTIQMGEVASGEVADVEPVAIDDPEDGEYTGVDNSGE